LKNILDSIDQKIEGISSINASKISTDDLASIKIELNGVNKALTKIEETNDERDNNVNSLQSATASIDSKLDDLIKSYNSYEYIPIINKDDSND
jgi:predicted  nucleic acid-binding Zn-ribbon protein